MRLNIKFIFQTNALNGFLQQRPPNLDENNKVVGLKGIAQDITKKKELELFLKAQEEAEKERQIKVLEEKSNSKFRSYNPLGEIIFYHIES